jgi:hypothetical protein
MYAPRFLSQSERGILIDPQVEVEVEVRSEKEGQDEGQVKKEGVEEVKVSKKKQDNHTPNDATAVRRFQGKYLNRSINQSINQSSNQQEIKVTKSKSRPPSLPYL